MENPRTKPKVLHSTRLSPFSTSSTLSPETNER